MNEQSGKCRICWEDKETKKCLSLSTKWGIESTKSIKEIILLCVPWMSVEDKNLICKPCLWQLKFTYKFVERCLKTENILNEANNKGIGSLSLEDIFEKSRENGNKIEIIFENPDSPGSQLDQDSNVELLESLQENDENVQTVNIQEEVNMESVPASNKNEAAVNLQMSIMENNDAPELNSCIRKGITTKSINGQENDVEINVLKKSGDLEEPDVLAKNEDVYADKDLEDSDYILNEFGKENTCKEAKGPGDSESNIISDSATETAILKQILDSGECNNSNKENATKVTHSLDPPVKNELTDLLDIVPVDVLFITSHSEITKEQQEGLINEGVNILNMSKDPTTKKRTIFLSRDLKLSIFECFKCRDKFKSRTDYVDHLHFHRKAKTPGSTVLTCPVCNETFGFDFDFRNHSKMIHGISNPHHCLKCNKKFKTLNLLKEHEKYFKDDEECIYKCKKCGKEYNKLSTLQQHEDDVKDAPCCNYHKCRICSKKFTKEEFKVHCSEVHRNYLCQECGKSFHEAASLSAHIRNVHNHVDSMCHECGKILSCPRVLDFHMRSVHGSKKFMCEICSRTFATIVYLRNHKKRHTDQSKKKILKCEKCGKEYFSKEGLLCHERIVHLKMKRYICHICNEGFARNDYFQRHLKTHVRFSKYCCPVCRKCFAVDWRLEHHMRAGHDENGKSLEKPDEPKKAPRRKYKYTKEQLKCVCKICNKVLANHNNLNLHYRSHLKLRKYKCKSCETTFQTKMSLSRHEKLHTDPNFEFSCNICHAYKSSSAELESHMLEVHKNKKYKCQLCSEAFGRKYLLDHHEVTVHQEDNYKKELILNILEKDHIFAKDDPGSSVKTKGKGRKIDSLEIDINKVYDELVNNRNSSGNCPGTSQDINSEEELQTNIQGNNAPVQIAGKKKVIVLSNEYGSMAERACKSIEEEIS